MVGSTSLTSPNAGGGGGAADCAPAAARRAGSRASRRDGRVLMPWPSSRVGTAWRLCLLRRCGITRHPLKRAPRDPGGSRSYLGDQSDTLV